MKPKLLCLDDEVNVLEALERLLKSEFKILTATHPSQALSLIKNNLDLSVILSDFRMPEMNGVEFLNQAKTLAPLAARVVLSGQMDTKEIGEAINRAEIHRFILKPWENDFLRVQLLEALQWHVNLTEKNQLRILSITDPVTGLYNHRFFQDQLQRSFKESVSQTLPLSLIMLDVDHFKSFNDRYGHAEGDRLLGAISKHIKDLCPSPITAARYGGEEFAILCPNTTIFVASRLAERLREAIEASDTPGPWGKRAYVTVSLGVAMLSADTNQPSDLVTRADEALYQAKHLGRNRTVAASSVN